MYRLLIVDDEEIITDSLYEVFQQMMAGKLDVCRAYSAKEALDWLARTRIDIILTDIRMPGMSGLELSEEIRVYWPRCRIIFLTGYSEFHYAYQAIQMPSVRYLLKTEGYSKVTDTVQEVIDELDHSRQIRQRLDQSKERLEALELLAQGEYFRQMLLESDTLAATDTLLGHDFAHLNIAFNPQAPVALALGRLASPHGLSYIEQSERLRSVRLIWDSYMKEQTLSLGIVDKHGDLIWFVQPAAHVEDKLGGHLIRYLEGTLEMVQEACFHSQALPISFTLSGSPCRWSSITEQYERLRKLQQMKLGDGIPVIVKDRVEAEEVASGREGQMLSYRASQLEAHLEGGREQEFIEGLDQLEQYVLHRGDNVQMAVEGYYAAALLLFSHINRLGHYQRISEAGKLMRLDDHASMREGFSYLRQIAKALFGLKKLEARDRTELVIDRICHYIESHLCEELSLVKLAEIHYFNPSYLSRLFKQERGVNLSEYIDKCRIRKAKELLREPEFKVRDVALRVGYEAAHSFTRFFKKVTGMTPQEYRDSLT